MLMRISLADLGKPNDYYQALLDYAKTNKCEVVPICAKIESEISQLESDEADLFIEELGLDEPGLNKVINSRLS